MERYKGGLRAYWRRRAYERLDPPRHRRRVWRFRIKPRLRVPLRFSLKRFFLRIRDAYVRMMLRLTSAGAAYGGAVGVGYGSEAFGPPRLKEYDERVVVEIYRSIMAQGHLLTAAPAGGGSDAQIEVRR